MFVWCFASLIKSWRRRKYYIWMSNIVVSFVIFWFARNKILINWTRLTTSCLYYFLIIHQLNIVSVQSLKIQKNKNFPLVYTQSTLCPTCLFLLELVSNCVCVSVCESPEWSCSKLVIKAGKHILTFCLVSLLPTLKFVLTGFSCNLFVLLQ